MAIACAANAVGNGAAPARREAGRKAFAGVDGSCECVLDQQQRLVRQILGCHP